MSKVIFWIVVVFVALLALRLYSVRQLRKRKSTRTARDAPRVGAMVRCVRCGVFLPQDETRKVATGFECKSGCDRPPA